jgi:hypothetical protein
MWSQDRWANLIAYDWDCSKLRARPPVMNTSAAKLEPNADTVGFELSHTETKTPPEGGAVVA